MGSFVLSTDGTNLVGWIKFRRYQVSIVVTRNVAAASAGTSGEEK
jgi:hypothetical protein